MKYLSKEEAKKISIEAVHILEDKKLEDIVLLELGDEAVCDYFIISHSANDRPFYLLERLNCEELFASHKSTLEK